ncbi:MAG: hypothetical protein Q8K30_02055 [Candidatus Gracilibacteria bacterium]|nr:hypothetical protein [Candidatus Gracilibacteria bacterium]
MIIKYNNDEEVENKLLKLFEYVGEKEHQLHILQVIEHILNNNGAPNPPNAKPLKGHELFEIRIKFGNDLYRINYFLDAQNDFMVILNWYNKPDGRNESGGYNKSKKKKLDQQIQMYIREALELREKYLLNKGNYELFN